METGITQNQIITQLAKSPHGKLTEYIPVGMAAARDHSEFFAHLIAWNHKNGQIRDSKVALPMISLLSPHYPAALVENSLAHVASLDPRNLVRAYRFVKSQPSLGNTLNIKRTITRYLRAREAKWSWFEKQAVQHRESLRELYALLHIKPMPAVDAALFKGNYVRGSVFDIIRNLKNMSPQEAAGTIAERRIPFLVAMGALGPKMKEPDLVLALISRMSPTELVTNTALLQKLGVATNPMLKSAYEQGLKRVAASKANTFKTTRAAENIKDEGLKQKLQGAQEKQLATMKGVGGNWLVLADKSGSMETAIETARQIAGALAKMVRGSVHLMFFDVAPRYFNVTGMPYEAILNLTRLVTAGGGTSVGCGLLYAVAAKLDFDGIAIVSDGGENSTPLFADVYKRADLDVPVYFYRLRGRESDRLSELLTEAKITFEDRDLSGGVDYYGLPALVQTMNCHRYSLVQEIFDTPLLTVDAVLGDALAVGV